MTDFSHRLPDFRRFPALRARNGSCRCRMPSRSPRLRRRQRPGPGAYDGTWNVMFATTRRQLQLGYSVPFMVHGGRVSSAGGGRVSGGVSRGGSVAVASPSAPPGRAAAAGSSAIRGAGRWSGIITGDRCSGTWQATRS